MFSGCSGLTSLDVSGFDTASVTNMSAMFSGCSGLTSLDVSGFDTASVTNMSSMFSGCSGLTSLDVSGFDTSSVTNMRYMFYDCLSLTSLDVSGFDTSLVTNMEAMFRGCSGLTSLDVSGFDTSLVTNMRHMFSYCSGLTSLDVSGFDTSSATSMSYMFCNCSGLTSLDVSGFDTSSVTDMSSMFSGCSKLTSLDVSGLDTSKVTDMRRMFANCSKLEYLSLGDAFRFKTTQSGSSVYTAELPNPPWNSPYTGKWTLQEDPRQVLTASELMNSYAGGAMAGTWQWQKSYGKIVFDGNGGGCTADSATILSDADPVLMPTAAEAQRPGYGLTGWSLVKEPGAGDAVYAPGESCANMGWFGVTTTLYAQWNYTGLYRYHVKTYQEDAETPGLYRLVEDSVSTAQEGATVSAQPKDFDGFLLDHVVPENASVVVTADESATISFYYRRTRYTLHFDGNGADGGAMGALSLVGGVTTRLPENKFYRPGFIFLGWNTESDGSGRSFSDGQSVLNLLGDGESLRLYAQWFGNDNPVTPTNGTLTVTLKAGQTLVIPDLPDGTTYSVREINLPHGWILSGIEDGDGTVTSNQRQYAVVNNRYDPSAASVKLVAHKRLVGATLVSGEYFFELIDSDGVWIDGKSNGPLDSIEQTLNAAGESIDNPWYGTGAVAFDELFFSEPGRYTYTIREYPGYAASIDYDQSVYTAVVDVVDLGDGTLDATLQYFDAEGNALGGEPVFVNRLHTSSLYLHKWRQNDNAATENTDFSFVLTLRDFSGNPMVGSFPVKHYDADGNLIETTSVSNGGTLTLHGGKMSSSDLEFGDYLIIEELPRGASYELREIEQPGWEQTSAFDESGVIGEYDASAIFENTYSSVGTLELEATKIFRGGALEDGMFSFELLDENGEQIEIAECSIDGRVCFSPIYFDQSQNGKTYIYTVREITESYEDDLVCDSHEAQFEVTVTDDGQGVLQPVIRMLDESAGLVFTNTRYRELSVSKTLDGKPRSSDESFRFTLRLWYENGDGARTPVTLSEQELVGLALTPSSEAGAYSFALRDGDRITLRLPGDVHYSIVEDEQYYLVSWKVTNGAGDTLQSGSGSSLAGVLTQNQTAAFTNTRPPVNPALSITKETTSEPANGNKYVENETIAYKLTVTNTGDVELANVVVNDELTGFTTTIETLAAGESKSFETAYIVTAADAEAGTVENTATVAADDPRDEEAKLTDEASVEDPTGVPGLKIEKETTSEPANGVKYVEGETVAYQLTVTNTGDVDLKNVVVNDELTGFTTTVETLAAGESKNFETAYVVTAADAEAGTVKNTATVAADDPRGEDAKLTDEDSVEDPTMKPDEPIPDLPGIAIRKTTTSTPENGKYYVEDEVIAYKLTVTNTGNVALDNVVVKDELTGLSVTVGTLAAGESQEILTTYVVKAADVEAGTVENTATVTADDPTNPDKPLTDDDSVEDPAGESGGPAPVVKPGVEIEKATTSKPANGSKYVEGETIEYKLTVTNTGNVTLTNLVIEDALTGLKETLVSLAVGESKEFDTSYVVTAADIETGTVKNTATVTADDPTDPDKLLTDDDSVEDPTKTLDPTYIDPPVKKVVTGQPEKDESFRFTLTLLSMPEGLATIPMPAGAKDKTATMEIVGSGEKEFGKIALTAEGTYVYKISEENTGAEGYTYDTAVYTLTAVVTREGDHLVVKETVERDGKVSQAITFTNVYKSAGDKPGPRTGDEAELALWSVMAMGSLMSLAAAWILSRKRYGAVK